MAAKRKVTKVWGIRINKLPDYKLSDYWLTYYGELSVNFESQKYLLKRVVNLLNCEELPKLKERKGR